MQAGMQPRILWAQTPQRIFLTIEVSGCTDASLDTFKDVEKGITLLCIDNSHDLHVRLELLGMIDQTTTSMKQTPRNIQIRLEKDVENTWERLLFEKSSYTNLAVDWERWAAEESDDDEQDLQNMMPPGFDMSALANMSESDENRADGSENEEDYENDIVDGSTS